MLVKKDSCNKDYWTSEIILGIILYFLFTGEHNNFLPLKPSQYLIPLHPFKYSTEEKLIFYKKRFEL